MNAMHLLEAMTDIESTIIENAQPQTKPKGKTITRILLLAALIAALTMTALATKEITNWFESYFAKYSEAPLTQDQITFIDENTTDLTQSKTYGGYTISVESAISDGINGFIKLKLTAPEHVVLDADLYYPYPGNGSYLTSEEMNSEDSQHMGLSCELVADNDDLPNTIGLMIRINGCVHDYTEWKLKIRKIMATYFDDPDTGEFQVRDKVVAVGFWDFDITFSETGKEEVELITEPVRTQVNISLEEPIYEDVNITSLRLRALGAEITYEYLEPEIINGRPHTPAGDFGYVYVVMKDGSEVWMITKSGYPGGCTFEFLAPIISEEVSYVLFPDGTRIYAQ